MQKYAALDHIFGCPGYKQFLIFIEKCIIEHFLKKVNDRKILKLENKNS